MADFDWESFQRARDLLHDGQAELALETLRILRQGHAEPAIATVMADALLRLGRADEAVVLLEADIAQGVDNHWTHYTLGHHHAARGAYAAAAMAFNRCHALQGWQQSLERGYVFTHDYFAGHIAQWHEWFEGVIDQRPLDILEIGSWEGGSTLWLLDQVLAKRGGQITCVDTWEGSSEHGFLAEMQVTIEQLFDRNIALSGQAQKVVKIKGSSQEVLARLRPRSYDFVYVDGAHEAKYVIQDAVLSHRLLREGGYLLFDDYFYRFEDGCQDTARAIDFFLSCFGADYELLAKAGQVLLRRGRSEGLGPP